MVRDGAARLLTMRDANPELLDRLRLSRAQGNVAALPLPETPE
jgi:hypothetical protein